MKSVGKDPKIVKKFTKNCANFLGGLERNLLVFRAGCYFSQIKIQISGSEQKITLKLAEDVHIHFLQHLDEKISKSLNLIF